MFSVTLPRNIATSHIIEAVLEQAPKLRIRLESENSASRISLSLSIENVELAESQHESFQLSKPVSQTSKGLQRKFLLNVLTSLSDLVRVTMVSAHSTNQRSGKSRNRKVKDRAYRFEGDYVQTPTGILSRNMTRYLDMALDDCIADYRQRCQNLKRR